MKVNFNTVKNSVKNALIKYCGVEEGEADGMIYGQDGLDKIMNDMFNLPPQIEANVYGLHIGEHEFDLCVTVDNDEPHSSMCLLQFGECIDIDGAREAIEEYSRGEFGDIFTVENEVNENNDIFMLNYSFEPTSLSELEFAIDMLFAMFTGEEFIGAVSKVLKYFD